MLQEFKDFVVKGNAFDLAVGVIIGAAFGAVAGSFVNDIMMPPLGLSPAAPTSRTCSSPSSRAPRPALPDAGGRQGRWRGHAQHRPVRQHGDQPGADRGGALPDGAGGELRPDTAAGPGGATPEDIVLLREIRDALKK